MALNKGFLKNTIARDLLIIVLLLAILPLLTTGYFTTLLGKAIIFGILAISLDIAWGYGGILSLGHSAFFGLGAYAFTLTAIDGGMSGIVFGVVLGIILPALLAALISWFVFFSKTTAFYIGVVTLSTAVLAERVTIRFSSFTGGQNGISGVPQFPFSGISIYYFLLVMFVGILFISYKFVNSDMGKVMVSIQENEERTKFFGYPTSMIRTLIFILSGAIAGFAGVLYAPFNGFVSPSLFAFMLGTQIIIWVAIGGRGKLVGAVIGALLINMLSPYFNEYFPYVWQIILGLLFISAVIFFPNGLYAFIGKKRQVDGTYKIIDAPFVVEATESGVKEILSLENLQVSFGSLSIIKDLDLTINAGEVQCIIGPNGAGKSTLVNAITGLYPPTSGRVMLEGAQIDQMSPEKIARRGVIRTFQSTTVIGTLTVAQNLQLASNKGKTPSARKRTFDIPLAPIAKKLTYLSQLDKKLDLLANELSHGEQQLLELCMALALQPKVLLLDEPTAGLTSLERKEIGELLIELAHEDNIALLVIEHDVEFVKEIADRVTVLFDGTIAADGTVEEVTQSELVREVYLGVGQ